MGGSTGTSTQQQQQTSQTQPWAPATPLLQGILGQLGGVQPGLTGAESGALSGLEANAARGNPYAGQIGGVASNLLAGGGPDRTGMVGDAYKQYQQQLNPYLQQSFLDPRTTPGFGDALSALNSDISGQINSQFAGAGRDLSGMNVQTLARGLSQGEGQLLANQYNQNVQSQLGAASSLYGAGGQTAGLLSGLDQTRLANQQAGAGMAGTALDAQNWGQQQTLMAEAARRGIPLQALQQIAGIGGGIAGLGGTQTSTSSGSSTMSPMQQFYMATSGIGSLFRSGSGGR